MILKVFSVFDSKLSTFSKPWYDLTEASAIRNFADNVNDANPKNPWFLHPEDYSLFYISDFDDQLGKYIIPKDEIFPRSLVTASSLFSPSKGLPSEIRDLVQ